MLRVSQGWNYIHEYGLLVNPWHDMRGNASAFETPGTLLEGQFAGIPIPRIEEANVGADGSRVFCILILSGIVDVLKSKYFPTGDITAGDLRLELTLAEAKYRVSGTGV